MRPATEPTQPVDIGPPTRGIRVSETVARMRAYIWFSNSYLALIFAVMAVDRVLS